MSINNFILESDIFHAIIDLTHHSGNGYNSKQLQNHVGWKKSRRLKKIALCFDDVRIYPSSARIAVSPYALKYAVKLLQFLYYGKQSRIRKSRPS